MEFEFIQESGPGECTSDMMESYGQIINIGESIIMEDGDEIVLDDIEADPKAANISIVSNGSVLDKRRILEGESIIFTGYDPEQDRQVRYQLKVKEVATGMTFAAKWARISITKCW